MSLDQDRPREARPGDADDGRMILLGHDLRAAVSDIIGGLRLIDPEGLADAARLQLERVRAASETLARLLEESLSLLLGEDEFAATHPASLQMTRFLYDLEMRWSGRAREKGLGFRLRRGDNVPETLALDRTAFERILSNILSNAVKYTDRGEVVMEVERAGSGALRISVVDQGPGFSAEALARLFEFRGRPDDSGKPGQGLGMHISHRLSGRLGGIITVENRPGGGARVTLDLPPEAWTLAEAETAPGEVPLPDLAGLRVLVAEDNETNQTILAHMLTRLGASHAIAPDGLAALELLDHGVFDLALIDIEMPKLNGLEVIRHLRREGGRSATLPVIAITAYVLRANRDAIYAAGADAILAKPFPAIENFGQAILDVLARTEPAGDTRPAASDDLAEFDRASFDQLMAVAGPEGARELLDRLHEDLRRSERGLLGGLSNGDAAVIRAETHVLIALAGAVGAARLHALARALNGAAHRNEADEFSRFGTPALEQLDRLITFVGEAKAARGGAAG